MMILNPKPVVLCGVAMLVAQSSALAQAPRRPAMRRYQSTVSQPFVSPYLNLVRPGGDPGLNYFTLVQPQLQQEHNTQVQSNQIQRLNRGLEQATQAQNSPYGPVGGIRSTGGRTASFRSYSHYYPSLGAGRSGGGAPPRNYPNPVGAGGGMMGGMGGMGSF